MIIKNINSYVNIPCRLAYFGSISVDFFSLYFRSLIIHHMIEDAVKFS